MPGSAKSAREKNMIVKAFFDKKQDYSSFKESTLHCNFVPCHASLHITSTNRFLENKKYKLTIWQFGFSSSSRPD